jgi:hypothetical protein
MKSAPGATREIQVNESSQRSFNQLSKEGDAKHEEVCTFNARSLRFPIA